jgi:hypothetical protein
MSNPSFNKADDRLNAEFDDVLRPAIGCNSALHAPAIQVYGRSQPGGAIGPPEGRSEWAGFLM